MESRLEVVALRVCHYLSCIGIHEEIPFEGHSVISDSQHHKNRSHRAVEDNNVFKTLKLES